MPSSASSAASNSGGGRCSSPAAIASAEAPTKHSSQMPYPSSSFTGGPNVRHVIGRDAYRSHVPVAGSSTGHTASFANASNDACEASSSNRTPVVGSPGKSNASASTLAATRARTAAAFVVLEVASRASPARSRSASNPEIRNTPVQHWLHPGLHASQSPLRTVASASALSTI